MSDPSPTTQKQKYAFGTRSNEERQASLAMALASKKAKYEARLASTVIVGRFTLAPDTDKTATGEGAGWKLSAPREPDRFFRSVDQAKQWVTGHS